MPTELARTLAFMDALKERCAERAVPFDRGRALFNDTHALVWDLNALRVDRPGDATAGELAAEADRLHSEAGHRHRRLFVPDDRAGAGLAEGLTLLGWEAERDVVMAYRGPGERGAGGIPVEELTAEEIHATRLEIARGEPWASSEEVARAVVAGLERIAEAGSGRHFGVRSDDGVIVCAADLFTDGRTAQVEDVATLPAHRGRGYASAAVLRAVEEALAAGNDLVFLVADDGDWPKELYARLGFEPLGYTWSFLKPPAPSPPMC